MNRQPPRTFEFGPFCLDVAEQRLVRDGRAVPLTPKLFELLRVLVEHAGHLVEKEELLKEVWSDTFVEEANLNRGISVLRKTLGETSVERYIETIPKRGYRFVAPVQAQDSDAVSTYAASPVPIPELPKAGETRTSQRTVWLSAGVAAAVALTIGALIDATLRRNETNGSVDSAGAGASIHRQLTFTGKELTPALSPDGRRIAYVSNESPHRRVMVRDLAGGEPVEVFKAPEAIGLRWSPDSTELMFRARGGGADGLYIATPPHGSPRRLTKNNMFVACWSPDGSTIAVALFLRKKIGVVNRVGEMQRTIPLSGTEDWIADIDWSPVADRILFVVDDHQRRPAIWTIRPDGSGQTRVLTAASEIVAARWAPSGDSIYYFARVNQTVSLYKAFVDPGRTTPELAATPLVSGLESGEGFSLSADGTRLVYARAPYHSNLWVVEAVNSPGGQEVRQTQLTSGTSLIERPRVSPNGQSIVFNMGYESRANLYTIPATGGAPKQLTFLNALSLGGVWSADGRMVAFASDEGGKGRVWVVHADGSSPQPLPTHDLSESYELIWAPGDRLLYQQTGNRNYYAVDLETRHQEPLIKDTSGWVFSPAYAPDGRKLALAWNHPAKGRGIYVIDSKDLRATLVSGQFAPSEPIPTPLGWSADRRFIYAIDGKRSVSRGVTVLLEETLTEARILKIPATGGRPATFLSLPFEEVGSVAMFPDGERFVCTVYWSRSAVWVVEDFDVSSRPRLARRAQ